MASIKAQWFMVMFVTCASFAQGEPARISYTVTEFVDRALAHSERLIAERARVVEAEEAAQQVGAWANPALSLSGGAKKDPANIGAIFHLSVSQDFSLGKQDLRRQLSISDRKLKEIELEEAELALISNVVRLSFDYALKKRKVEFAQARKSRFTLLHSYLAGHTFATPQQRAVKLAVQDRLRNLEVDEKRLEGELKSVHAELSVYDGGLAHQAEITVPWFQGKRELNEDEWISVALANSVPLARQRVEIDRAKNQESLFKRERWPDISLSGFYNQETLGITERIFGLGLSFSVPLWNRNQAALRSNSQKLIAEAHFLSLCERQTVAFARKLLAEYDAARKIVHVYHEAAIERLLVNLQDIEKEFRKNRVDFLLFLDLDVQAAETASRVFDAQRSFLEVISALYFLHRDKNLAIDLAKF